MAKSALLEAVLTARRLSLALDRFRKDVCLLRATPESTQNLARSANAADMLFRSPEADGLRRYAERQDSQIWKNLLRGIDEWRERLPRLTNDLDYDASLGAPSRFFGHDIGKLNLSIFMLCASVQYIEQLPDVLPLLTEDGVACCPHCRNPLSVDDPPDGLCHDCRSGRGRMYGLEIALRTGSKSLEQFADLPALRDVARELFRDSTFTAVTFEKIKDWLRGRGFNGEQILLMTLREVIQVLVSTKDPSGKGNRGVGAAEELAALEKNTPCLDRKSRKWVTNKRAAEIEGLEVETLSRYRTKGVKNATGTLGCDPAGRVWRRDGTPGSHPWYFRSSLLRGKDR